MRVYNVPSSAPLLRTLIAALVDGRLIAGFDARAHPERLAEATLYLPTRRAGRMAREIFLDVLKTDAVVLPRDSASFPALAPMPHILRAKCRRRAAASLQLPGPEAAASSSAETGVARAGPDSRPMRGGAGSRPPRRPRTSSS